MRRTLFVVNDDLAPVVQTSCTVAVEQASRRRYVKFVQDAGAGDGAWLRELEESAATALAKVGEATGAQLSTLEPRLRTPIDVTAGGRTIGSTNVTSWVLFLLAAQGRIVRGRPQGTWTSGAYRWSPVERWLPGGMPAIDQATAASELVRRYLRAYGPATTADIRWWTGWSAGTLKKALVDVAPEEVDLDGEPGLVLPDDLQPTPPVAPWVALLPALDPTPMGWTGRAWFLGPHAPQLFDRSGNVGPTVWSDGRIVGGWAHRADGSVAVRLLEDVGAEKTAGIQACADRLATWIGPARITPRFRTPMERTLTTP